MYNNIIDRCLALHVHLYILHPRSQHVFVSQTFSTQHTIRVLIIDAQRHAHDWKCLQQSRMCLHNVCLRLCERKRRKRTYFDMQNVLKGCIELFIIIGRRLQGVCGYTSLDLYRKSMHPKRHPQAAKKCKMH